MTDQVILERIGKLNGWSYDKELKKISKEYQFKNFVQAMQFATQITPLAEEMNHHPDLLLSWGKVKVELTTHDSSGVSEKDISLAEKIDEIKSPMV
jgi:4a-hydroxytetrahydrobiopterin dehydratase